MTIWEEIEVFKRQKLEERLSQITPEQLSKFRRIYPGVVPKDDMERAIDLCDRTIKKNLKEPPK